MNKIDDVLRQLANGEMTLEAASRALNQRRGRGRPKSRGKELAASMVTTITDPATGQTFTLKTLYNPKLTGNKLIIGRMYTELRDLGHSHQVAISKIQRAIKRPGDSLPYSKEHILKCANTFKRQHNRDAEKSWVPRPPWD